jgi:hypothetical protein
LIFSMISSLDLSWEKSWSSPTSMVWWFIPKTVIRPKVGSQIPLQ